MNKMKLVQEIVECRVVGMVWIVANMNTQVMAKGAADNGLSQLLPCFVDCRVDSVLLLDIVFFSREDRSSDFETRKGFEADF